MIYFFSDPWWYKNSFIQILIFISDSVCSFLVCVTCFRCKTCVFITNTQISLHKKQYEACSFRQQRSPRIELVSANIFQSRKKNRRSVYFHKTSIRLKYPFGEECSSLNIEKVSFHSLHWIRSISYIPLSPNRSFKSCDFNKR